MWENKSGKSYQVKLTLAVLRCSLSDLVTLMLNPECLKEIRISVNPHSRVKYKVFHVFFVTSWNISFLISKSVDVWGW